MLTRIIFILVCNTFGLYLYQNTNGNFFRGLLYTITFLDRDLHVVLKCLLMRLKYYFEVWNVIKEMLI